ncbi:hypothetical protein G4Y79_04325 [Phototrophicus methaneseepsis]|uniref:Uncharacterized protein n=1 Tax=Phototrophicus methaneseepsis TaxID=2710758 RepID=A0A7S8EAZ3_9CHLR|nr:hypothetical protein [Phototrophicus methaneseepsis]QPC83615.1 hypothetical protein G4Y79_04325 [Phototrophicus methaneseepsis]
MSDLMNEPPPLNWNELEPPPDVDDGLDYDSAWEYGPYPPLDEDLLDTDLFDTSWLVNLSPAPPEVASAIQTSEFAGDEWAWHDARLVGVDRGEFAGDTRYEVGAMDLYANLKTGDLGGSYLTLAAFAEEAPAVGFYHDLNRQIHEAALPAHEVPSFAETQAMAMQSEPLNWRSARPEEYTAYEYLRDLDTFEPTRADEPSEQALDPLLQTALELGGVIEPQLESENVQQALDAIGVEVENFDSDMDSAPFYDTETSTAYWIGVFQADREDRDNCVTSILSMGRNPETGEMEAQLAPCVPGDWDKAYSAAEYLIDVAQRGGIEQVFDAAEGMALATDQREFWQSERGLSLEADTAREMADYARDNWEMSL